MGVPGHNSTVHHPREIDIEVVGFYSHRIIESTINFINISEQSNLIMKLPVLNCYIHSQHSTNILLRTLLITIRLKCLKYLGEWWGEGVEKASQWGTS